MDISNFNFCSDQILSALTEEQREAFFSYRKLFVFDAGKLIFHDHGIPTGVYFLEEGFAKIYKIGFMGKQQIFYIYKPGDLLGYQAMLCNEPYEDFCEALTQCKLSFIEKEDFKHLMDTIPTLKDLLIKNISHEFGVLVNSIAVLAQKTVRERLALFLLVLEERFRKNNHKEGVIFLSREDLANVIGARRESLTRMLSEFKNDGIIKVDGRNIKIKDKSSLEQIAFQY